MPRREDRKRRRRERAAVLAHEARTGRRSLPRRRAYNRSVRRARRRRNTTPPLCHRVPAHHSKRHPVRGAPARCRRSSDGKIFALPRLYSRAECGRRAAGGGGFTRRASCAPFQRAPTRAERRRPRGGGGESVNILGTALEECPDEKQDEEGSWTEHARTCTKDLLHNICVQNLPKDFARVTVQGNWSESYPHYHNHCVCNGAYTEYVTSPKEKETLQLKCEAIPGNIDEHNWLWEKTSITDEQRCAALKHLESTCLEQKPQDPAAFKAKFREWRKQWCPNEAADSQAQEETDEENKHNYNTSHR